MIEKNCGFCKYLCLGGVCIEKGYDKLETDWMRLTVKRKECLFKAKIKEFLRVIK